MYKELLLVFSQRLKEEHFVLFRLYNALYRITLTREGYTIQQDGLNISYTFDSLRDVFENYIVYGDRLIELINDIKLC